MRALPVGQVQAQRWGGVLGMGLGWWDRPWLLDLVLTHLGRPWLLAHGALILSRVWPCFSVSFLSHILLFLSCSQCETIVRVP